MGRRGRVYTSIAMAVALVALQIPSYVPHLELTIPRAAAAVSGFDATFFGESANYVTARTAGTSLNFQVFYTNTGTTTWTRGTSTQVDLAVCLPNVVISIRCDVTSPNAPWNSAPAAGGWMSSTRYATSTETSVAPGSNGTFSWNVTVPSGTTDSKYDFYFALVLASTGELIKNEVHRKTVWLTDGTVFMVTNTVDGGAGSFRAAIDAANANPGRDTIHFAIDATPTINLLSALPTITSSITIDATTQFGFVDVPLVELNGAATTGVSGLTYGSTGGGGIVRGLVINNFGRYGIEATAGGGNLVVGNFIGTDRSGTAAAGNGTSAPLSGGGIFVNTPGYEIGQFGPSDANLIAGNFGNGIDIASADAPLTHVVGNYLGQLPSARVPVPNALNGIYVGAPSATVEQNFIKGNTRSGIALASDFGAYRDNFVLANGGSGILMSGSGNVFERNDIRSNGSGGVLMGFPSATTRNNRFTDNTVRDNSGAGFALRGPVPDTTEVTDGNVINGGSITNNGLAGIELAFGANLSVPPPAITQVTITPAPQLSLTVAGTAARNALVQLYDDAGDEGVEFLGSAIASDGDGSWSMSSFLTTDLNGLITALQSGARFLHATQTRFELDESGNTSAFSAAGLLSAPLVGVAQCRFTTGGIEAPITTRLLPFATVQLLSGNSVVDQIEATASGAYAFTGLSPNAHYNVRYDGFASNEQRYQCAVDNVVTNALGGGTVRLPTALLNRLNHVWFRPVKLSSGSPLEDVIPTPGVSTWYRIAVRPNERLTIRLTNPPTDYTVLAFTDLFAVAKALKEQGATLASVRRLTSTQDHAAPDLDSPDLDSPDLDSPDLDSPDLDSPDLDSPDLDSPDLDSPDLDSPDLDSPDIDSPDLDSPDLDSGGHPIPVAQEAKTYGSVYVAAQRRGLRAFSANPGIVSETIVLNTRSYSGDVYIRVRPHGQLSSSERFTISATTEGGEGCVSAVLNQRQPSSAVGFGSKKTLILTNTAGSWFTAPGVATKAQFLGALDTLALRNEVQGIRVDLADDANIQLNIADWRTAAGITCVAQANTVAQSIKQLVDLYRAHYGIEYLVLAGPDAALPLYRVRDGSELSRESRYSAGLDALSAQETALVQDYVLTDAFYGAPRVTTRSGHEFFLSEIGIGRLVESRDDIMKYLTNYMSPTVDHSSVRVQRAFSSGYDFLSDLETYTAAALTREGAAVTSLNSNTWTADDLRGFLFGAQRFQFLSLQAHGRANRLVPANDGPRLLASEIAAVTDGRFAGTLLFSLACHLEGFNLQDADVLPQNDRVSFPEAFAAQGATAVGVSGFGYGHSPLLKNGEVVFAMLSDEIGYTADLNNVAYGPRGVPIGKALNIALLRFLNTLADVRGIEAKVINETMIYGLPMFAVQTPSTFSRPTSASIVPALTQLSAPLGLYLGQPPTQSFSLNSHTLGAGTYFDAGTLDDTSTIPLRPIVPSKSVNVRATVPSGDVVPRGAVFYGGTYTDTPGFVPVLAIPATQDAPTLPPTKYRNTAFAPGRLVRLNEYAGDAAVFIPFQYLGQGASGIARTYSSITTRLYYSTLTGDAALVDAPTISQVTLTPTLSGMVEVTAVISGRTVPGVQEVFATFTATSGPLAGLWKSIALTAGIPVSGSAKTCITIFSTGDSCSFTNTYTGVIDPADGQPVARDPFALRVDIQAVGGNALVGYATNGGLHYQVVDETATAAKPKRAGTLTITSAPTSATYRSRLSVSAKLVDAANPATCTPSHALPCPIVGKTVLFKVAGSYAEAVTDTDGVANVTMTANAPPNPAPRLAYHITASLPEDIDVLAAPAESDLRVTPGPTRFTATAGVAIDYSDSAVIARLLLTSRNIGLQDQPVTVDLGAAGSVITYTDRNGDVKLDTLDFGGLAPGSYAGSIAFKGENVGAPSLSRFAASTTPIAFTVTAEFATITPRMRPQSEGILRLEATLAQATDGSLGDMARATVHYVVKNQLGNVVTQGTTPAAAGAGGTGTWSAPVTLQNGIYTVELDVRGSFTSVMEDSTLAVFEQRSVSAGAGRVIAGADARGVPTGSRMLFAYVLRYAGANSTLPVGLELTLFRPSNANFVSLNFDWLVVTRSSGVGRAEFAGTGRLNGQTGWSFRAIATTAGENGTFELRIWKSPASFASPNYLVRGQVTVGGIFIR